MLTFPHGPWCWVGALLLVGAARILVGVVAGSMRVTWRAYDEPGPADTPADTPADGEGARPPYEPWRDSEDWDEWLGDDDWP